MRSLLDLQHIVGPEFDRSRDSVAVSRSEEKRAENQHVQGTLQQFDAFLLF